MRGRCIVIVQMYVDGTAATMSMGMFMPGEHGDPAGHRRIERVVRHGCPMLMVVVMILALPVIVAMVVVFCKAGAVGMRMAVVFDRHNDVEAVRLWNFFN